MPYSPHPEKRGKEMKRNEGINKNEEVREGE